MSKLPFDTFLGLKDYASATVIKASNVHHLLFVLEEASREGVDEVGSHIIGAIEAIKQLADEVTQRCDDVSEGIGRIAKPGDIADMEAAQ